MPKQVKEKFILNVGQRKEIIKFRNENQDISYRKIATLFAKKWNNSKFNRGHVERALTQSKKILALPEKFNKINRLPSDQEPLLYEELYKEFLLQKQHREMNLQILHILLKRLSSQEKYENFFSNFMFGECLIRRWRDIYGVKLKRIKGTWIPVPADDSETDKIDIKEECHVLPLTPF